MKLLARQKQTYRLKRMNLWLSEGRMGDKIIWNGHVHTAIFKTDNQQGPTVQHIEHCSMLCGNLDGMGVWGRIGTCVYMTESFRCSPEILQHC